MKHLEENFGEGKLTDLARKHKSLNLDGPKKTIFVYWHQGWQFAPALISKIKNHNKLIAQTHNLQIEFLDSKSIANYISINPSIQKLFEENKISIQGYSDILRLQLIEVKGGIWIDATVMLNPEYLKTILDCNDFYFNSSAALHRVKKHSFTVNTWMFGAIHSREFLYLWRMVLETTWLENSGQYFYFDAFDIATFLVKNGFNPKNELSQEFQVQVFNHMNLFLLAALRNDGEEILKNLYHKSPIIKLNHKISSSEQNLLINAIECVG